MHRGVRGVRTALGGEGLHSACHLRRAMERRPHRVSCERLEQKLSGVCAARRVLLRGGVKAARTRHVEPARTAARPHARDGRRGWRWREASGRVLLAEQTLTHAQGVGTSRIRCWAALMGCVYACESVYECGSATYRTGLLRTWSYRVGAPKTTFWTLRVVLPVRVALSVTTSSISLASSSCVM